MREYQVSFDEINRDIIDSVVVDWLNKYPLQGESALSVVDPDDAESVKTWVNGVWGRITHQIVSSGLPFDNAQILKVARKTFYAQLSAHPWYEKIKPYLPKTESK
jgi:hypothetical protein